MMEIYLQELNLAVKALTDYKESVKENHIKFSDKKYNLLVETLNTRLFEYISNVAIITHKNNNAVALVSLYDMDIRTQVAEDSLLKLQKSLPLLVEMTSTERCRFISTVTTNAMKDYKKHALIWLKHNMLTLDETFEDGTPKMTISDEVDIDFVILMGECMADVLKYSAKNFSALDIIALFSDDLRYPLKDAAKDLTLDGEYKVFNNFLKDLLKKYPYASTNDFSDILEQSRIMDKKFLKPVGVISHNLSNRKLLARKRILAEFPEIKRILSSSYK